jgi:hypothetical protein
MGAKRRWVAQSVFHEIGCWLTCSWLLTSVAAGASHAEYESHFLPTTFSQEQPSRCSGSNTGVAFALGIVTAPSNSHHREAIRKTWLRLPNVLNSTLEYKFFVGVQQNGSSFPNIRMEADKYGDIVEIGCEEGYDNIKFKAVAIFRWGE